MPSRAAHLRFLAPARANLAISCGAPARVLTSSGHDPERPERAPARPRRSAPAEPPGRRTPPARPPAPRPPPPPWGPPPGWRLGWAPPACPPPAAAPARPARPRRSCSFVFGGLFLVFFAFLCLAYGAVKGESPAPRLRAAHRRRGDEGRPSAWARRRGGRAGPEAAEALRRRRRHEGGGGAHRLARRRGGPSQEIHDEVAPAREEEDGGLLHGQPGRLGRAATSPWRCPKIVAAPGHAHRLHRRHHRSSPTCRGSAAAARREDGDGQEREAEGRRQPVPRDDAARIAPTGRSWSIASTGSSSRRSPRGATSRSSRSRRSPTAA